MTIRDAQFGIARILRPYLGFEGVYEGVDASTPIMFTEGGKPLDVKAGTPGYSANLLRGLAVPYGAQLDIWVPAVYGQRGSDPSSSAIAYNWKFTFRLRNTHDYGETRTPYHLSKQGEGVADTTLGNAGPRVVVPAGRPGLGYVQPEPGTAVGFAETHYHVATPVFGPEELPYAPYPLLPNGNTGEYQQGLFNPANSPGGSQALFQRYRLCSFGDELLVEASRRPFSTFGNWDFGNFDLVFSTLFGAGDAHPDVGVFVLAGSAP